MCLACAETAVNTPGIRLYGNFASNGSFGRVSRGLKEGLADLGILAGCVEVDSACSDDMADVAGSAAKIGIYAGRPNLLMTMASHGTHAQHFGILAPNSTWLPEQLVKSMQKYATIVAPSTWGADILGQYTGELLPPLRHGISKDFEALVSLGSVLVNNLRRGQFHVLHMSSTDKERKGTRELIAAWKSLVLAGELGPSPKLTIIANVPPGTYPDAESDAAISIVTRHLNATTTQAAALYQSFHVLCQPSRGEGFGLCPLEARACGIPVVATDCTGHADHMAGFDEGCVVVETGALAPMDDGPTGTAPSLQVASVRAGIKTAYDNWEQLFVNARQNANNVSREWAWGKVTSQWLREMSLQ